MSRGNPDYTDIETQTAFRENNDININAFDVGFSRHNPGGRVIWFDDFKNGLNRFSLASASGGADPQHVFLDGKTYGVHGSAMLDPVVINGASDMILYAAMLLSGKVGVEFNVFLSPNYCDLIVAFGSSHSGDTLIRGNFKIAGSSGAVQINDNGVFRSIYTPLSAGVLQDRFIPVKIVFDPSTKKYVSLAFAGTSYDLSSYSLLELGTALPGQILLWFEGKGNTAGKLEPIYIGYNIISADEP